MTGSVVGPYELGERLGAGAMGEVYLAVDTRLQRQVAVKCLRIGDTNPDIFRARALREARAAARLTHPNIAAIHDVVDLGDRIFIVMEYVKGESLAAKLRNGPLPIDDVRRCGRQLASALAAAQAEGIIHRDLKPANLHVTPDGVLKVLDFGVAKMTAASGTALDLTVGAHPGTPMYMSPEQLFGGPVDGRSDIYAAGVILFEMATGRRPYEPPNYAELAVAISKEAPRASSLVPEIPADLSDSIAKALERDPAARFQTAGELERALASEGSSAAFGVRRVKPAPSSRTRRASIAAAVAVIVAIAGIAGAVRLRRAGVITKASDIAVLPLANLSGDASQEYLADGMTEAIIAELGRVRSLRVISRQSVMRYKQATTPVPQIASELGVNAIVTGSLTRVGDRVRLTVALVQPSPERQVWSNVYDGGVGDVLTLSSRVAEETLQRMSATVTPEERAQLARARPLSPAVQEAYLTGRYYWNRRTKSGVERAIAEFKKAIELDPKAAVAYVGLADSYIVAKDNGYVPPEEALREAKVNAARALELDDALAEAHASLGQVYSAGASWIPAEKELRLAVSMKPGYATAHQWLANLLSILGRHPEAVAEATRALELDPLSPLQNVVLGQRLYFAGSYGAAAVQLQKAIDLDPSFAFGHALLGRVHVAQREYKTAIGEFEQAVRLEPAIRDDLAYGYAVAGEVAAAKKILGNLLADSAQQYISPHSIGLVYLGLGNKEEAIAWFTKAYQQSDAVVREMAVDPRLIPIGEDDRFLALLRNSGLAFRPGRSGS